MTASSSFFLAPPPPPPFRFVSQRKNWETVPSSRRRIQDRAWRSLELGMGRLWRGHWFCDVEKKMRPYLFLQKRGWFRKDRDHESVSQYRLEPEAWECHRGVAAWGGPGLWTDVLFVISFHIVQISVEGAIIQRGLVAPYTLDPTLPATAEASFPPMEVMGWWNAAFHAPLYSQS